MKLKILSTKKYKVINLDRKKAIRERCLNCSGWQPKDVRNCVLSGCPLYPFRTGKGKQDPKARKRAIRQYCVGCMSGRRNEVKKCTSFDCPLFTFRMKQLDRSIEIKSVVKKAHIQHDSKNHCFKDSLSMSEREKIFFSAPYDEISKMISIQAMS